MIKGLSLIFNNLSSTPVSTYVGPFLKEGENCHRLMYA